MFLPVIVVFLVAVGLRLSLTCRWQFQEFWVQLVTPTGVMNRQVWAVCQSCKTLQPLGFGFGLDFVGFCCCQFWVFLFCSCFFVCCFCLGFFCFIFSGCLFAWGGGCVFVLFCFFSYSSSHCCFEMVLQIKSVQHNVWVCGHGCGGFCPNYIWHFNETSSPW